jgi:aryl-alcohol dehydrogenase-like predicted oxidoreductase
LRDLAGNMPQLPFSPSGLTLGTVQLGLRYGIANQAGQPSETESFAILDVASAGGVTTLDTARAYGTSEHIIGRWLVARGQPPIHVVTKFPRLSASEPIGLLDAHVKASLLALGRPPDLVLAHSAGDLLNPAVVDLLEAAVASGRISAFGASVYAPEIALRLLRTVPIAALQLPLSAVDCRFQVAGVLVEARERGVAVFARSVFLQGALLMLPEQLPTHLIAIATPLRALRAAALDAGRSLSELLLIHARDTPGVSSLVLGVERAEQLTPHLVAFGGPGLSDETRERIADVAAPLAPEIIDPSRWPPTAQASHEPPR